MTLSTRPPRPDPDAGRKSAPQPRIWVEGRQKPRFDLRAWLAVSQAMAQRDLDPALLDAVQRLQGFGGRVQRGEIRVPTPWAHRVLPSHLRVGGWLLTLAQLLADSRHLIVGEEKAPTAPRPRPTVPTAEPTLHAIRAALGTVPHDSSIPAPPPAAAQGTISRLVWPLATRATLAILLAFALPAGAIKALLFHLDGGDLATWS